MEEHTTQSHYRAVRLRDARFDGRLFVGITSTGIYCRPVCPARTPRFEHCRFFPSAAAAQCAGFRPCLRCRPETAPDLAFWRESSNMLSRALALIAENGLDGDKDTETLAARLGLDNRQLHGLFRTYLDSSPLLVEQTGRVLFAKQLLYETQMPIAQIALAAGFRSVQQFNETFRLLFRRPPSSLRRKGLRSDARAPIRLILRYRAPYDWETIISYLAARVIAGVEFVGGGIYRRTSIVNGVCGMVEVAHEGVRDSLKVTIRGPGAVRSRTLRTIVARVRLVFDLNADIEMIESHLRSDPLLAPLVAQRPGLRVPGAWDGFEAAARAVLGQQITVEAGRRLAGKLVALCGQPMPPHSRIDEHLTHLFPSARCVADADLSLLGMPEMRRTTLKLLAQAAVANPQLLEARGTLDDELARLRSIPGIGPWTVEYIALRALRQPNAFPASDVALLRSMSRLTGERPTPNGLLDRADLWRPWRAYAAQHLWAAEVVHP